MRLSCGVWGFLLSFQAAAAFQAFPRRHLSSQGRWEERAYRQQGLERLTPLGLSTADFKNGLTIEFEGSPWRVVDFLHVKPGKGSAFVRTKLKNCVTGQQLEKTWRAGESVDGADVNTVEVS
jgi:hypothetical protein